MLGLGFWGLGFRVKTWVVFNRFRAFVVLVKVFWAFRVSRLPRAFSGTACSRTAPHIPASAASTGQHFEQELPTTQHPEHQSDNVFKRNPRQHKAFNRNTLTAQQHEHQLDRTCKRTLPAGRHHEHQLDRACNRIPQTAQHREHQLDSIFNINP